MSRVFKTKTGNFDFISNTGNIGNITQAGAWTLGGAGGTRQQLLNGYFRTVYNSTSDGGLKILGLLSGSTSRIQAEGVDSGTAGALEFSTAGATGTGASVVGGYSNIGAWTIGATTTSTYHLAQSSSSAHVVRFKNPTDNAAAYVGFSNNTALIGQIGFAAGGVLEFYGGAAGITYVGGATAAGAWTLGPSGGMAAGANYHKFCGGNVGTYYPTPGLHLAIGQNQSATFGGGQAEFSFINCYAAATGAFKWYHQTGASALTDLGGISTTGAWTLGSTGLVTAGTPVVHTLAGNLTAPVGNNTPYACEIALQIGSTSGEISQIVSQGNLREQNGTKLVFRTSNTSAVLTEVGSVDRAGSWSLGYSTGNHNHTLFIPTNGNYVRLQGSGYAVDHIMDATGYRMQTNSGSRDIRIVANTLGVGLAAGGTSWGSLSDIRFKRDIVALNYGLNTINQIETIRFNYIEDEAERSSRIGFSAQNLIEIVPEAVVTNNPEMLNVSPTELIPVLVKAIQELNAKVEAQQIEINNLKAAG